MTKPQAILLATGGAALAYWPSVVIGGLLWLDLAMTKIKE